MENWFDAIAIFVIIYLLSMGVMLRPIFEVESAIYYRRNGKEVRFARSRSVSWAVICLFLSPLIIAIGAVSAVMKFRLQSKLRKIPMFINCQAPLLHIKDSESDGLKTEHWYCPIHEVTVYNHQGNRKSFSQLVCPEQIFNPEYERVRDSFWYRW